MMLLGKRPRGQMKRTASVSGITVDVVRDDHNPSTGGEIPPVMVMGSQSLNSNDHVMNNYNLSFLSPRVRRNLSAFNENDHSSINFLRSCTFCRRRLSPARDIYMYMGDTAFCSAECRQEKMEQDWRKENDAAATTVRGGGLT